jgi:hypothetical protein
MITLKDYQTRVLKTLGGFFRECSRLGNPADAFVAAQEQQGRPPLPYLPVVAEGLAREMPYVCLRVPTGGGKTLLACHAAGLAITDLLQAERAVVLWLVPSNTILDQTAAALRNPRHPYRRGNASNVLHHVSAAELKAADMIKLPIRVIVRHPSQRDQLLAEALTLRGDLERLAATEAQATGEYLRPILLVQAERVDACEPLRQRLMADFGIAKEQILISVGRLDELKDSADIAAPTCPVRVILTVEKLRDGWDCPFAYVLCSLKETRSATAIEQIVGRILRLPQARAKQHPDLNCAYVLSVSPSISDVLAELAFGGNGATRLPTPYEQRLPFRVPRLCLQEDGLFHEFEGTHLLEHPWKLSAKDAALPADYSPLRRPTGKGGAIDVTAIRLPAQRRPHPRGRV